MLLLIVALQVVLLIAVVLVLRRKPAAPPPDPRLQQMCDAFITLHARLDTADGGSRAALAELRREHADAAQRSQSTAEAQARLLRDEVHARIEQLGKALADGLHGFRLDNASGADKLREQVHTSLREIDGRLQVFVRDTATAHTTAQTVLHGKLNELGEKNRQSHESLRESVQSKLAGLGEQQQTHHERMSESVQQRLDKLNDANSAKLEEMRKTVDEKLESTLNERLTASFSHVGEGLKQVNQGIGEMKALSTEVGDLKRVFTNVKARGIVGEFQLGQLLEQMFSREQYEKNVQIKPGSAERVEYALKVPRGNGADEENDTVLFPIDSKWPREDWERLEDAYEHADAEAIQRAGAAFERAIRAEGKSICEKYIDEPRTLPHAIMFLPTEGLYGEVMRRPGLQQHLQQQCNVTIAGPSTLTAILTSFRMGFHTIAMERKGHEIEKVLTNVKKEFNTFGTLIQKVEKKITETQNALSDVRSKTTTIQRALKSVTELPESTTSQTAALPVLLSEFALESEDS